MNVTNKTFIWIALRSNQNIYIDGTDPVCHIDDTLIDAFNHELILMGFYLSEEARSAIKTLPENEFKSLVDNTFETLSDMVGVNVRMRPLYRNFPNSVPQSTLVHGNSKSINARLLDLLNSTSGDMDVLTDHDTYPCGHVVVGYMSEGQCPQCAGDVSEVDLLESVDCSRINHTPKAINLFNRSDIVELVKSCVESRNGMTLLQIEFFKNALVEMDEEETSYVFSGEIPFKETVSIVVNELLKTRAYNEVYDMTKGFIKTANDVMRIAEQLNQLSDNPDGKFKLNNKCRKFVAKSLNHISNPYEDMVKKREKWVALNMSVHFGTFRKKYPNAFKAVDTVLNHANTIKTFDGKLQKALIEDKDLSKVLDLVVSRPGIFVRNLDSICRKFPESIETILSKFETCGHDASMRVLISARDNFSMRIHHYESERVYINVNGFLNLIEETREDISDENCEKIIASIDNVIANKLKNNDISGKTIYIDPVLKNRIMPLKLRSMKDSMFKAERGSSINLDDTGYIRFFTYWKENDISGCVDLDLSIKIYDEGLGYVEECSYYSTHGKYSTHSGDITSAPNGASEFVDVDIDKLKRSNNGAKYVVTYVNVFSSQKLDEFEAYTGFMCNNSKGDNKVYDPKTITDRFDLTCNARAVLCTIYDIDRNVMYWADMPEHNITSSNLSSRSKSIDIQIKHILNVNKAHMKMWDYFEILAKANNMKIADTPEDADVVIDNSVTQDIEDFNKKWMV